MDLDAIAQTMFGNSPAAPAARPEATAPSMAERLFGGAPAKPDARQQATDTDTDAAERLFGGGPPELRHGDAGRAIERAALETHLASSEAAKAAAAEWTATFDKFGLTSTESAQLADLGASAFARAPDEQTRAGWESQARDALAQDFGPHGAAQALADAQALIAKHGTPQLRRVLEDTGLGSHPWVVRTAAAKAHALRLAGRL